MKESEHLEKTLSILLQKLSKDVSYQRSHSAEPPPAFESNPWDRLGEDCHKYDRGHLLIIGGSAGKTGAIQLAGKAAYRAGAGWVSLAPLAKLHSPDPIFTTEQVWEDSMLSAVKLREVLLERKVKALVIGPGLVNQVLNQNILKILSQWQRQTNGFLVLDAGTLHGIAPILSGTLPDRTLLTPHPGEWQKLGKPPSEGIPATLAYKSSQPIVFGKHLWMIASKPNRVLARAGVGDALAGAAAAYGGLGLDADEAFIRACRLLRTTAENLTNTRCRDSITTSDIIEAIGLCSPMM